MVTRLTTAECVAATYVWEVRPALQEMRFTQQLGAMPRYAALW
jgi:negative regulator of sigma E activity